MRAISRGETTRVVVVEDASGGESLAADGRADPQLQYVVCRGGPVRSSRLGFCSDHVVGGGTGGGAGTRGRLCRGGIGINFEKRAAGRSGR